MFREIRRKDRGIDTTDAIEILRKGEYGILSTVNEEGYAYGVPLSYVYINDAIYFHCAVTGHKLDNIKNNSKTSFCVVGKTQPIAEKFTTNYESAIVFGKAEEVYNDEKYNALVGILDKYSKGYMELGIEHIKGANNRVKVIKISIENVTGKARR
ncbi:pyridoxamine 5'-phosphate oxidase family protein [Clostridium sp. BSD9I1]|uniref:pyridoxamine 5'-phosphate oxidase family protein n=1 Tax=Clostridium sp. BSD9I1 TaxID=2003589 RepID=UPI0016491429|nr:pyridoxamine 5'-phosphate oxidase family protein [Clostridium sp. BSD9I1]